jgi:hypothetical protein
MCVWFPWLQRIQPQHGSGRSFPRKSRHNSVQKATSSELQDGNVVSEKPGSLQEAAEKISRDFELSDDDIRRISYGFVTQLGTSIFAVSVRLLLMASRGGTVQTWLHD